MKLWLWFKKMYVRCIILWLKLINCWLLIISTGLTWFGNSHVQFNEPFLSWIINETMNMYDLLFGADLEENHIFSLLK